MSVSCWARPGRSWLPGLPIRSGAAAAGGAGRPDQQSCLLSPDLWFHSISSHKSCVEATHIPTGGEKKHKLEVWDLERVYITAIHIAWDEMLFSLEIKQSLGHSATGLCLCPRFFMGFSHHPSSPSPLCPSAFPPSVHLLTDVSYSVTLYPSHAHGVSPSTFKVISHQGLLKEGHCLLKRNLGTWHSNTTFFFTLQQSKCPLCVRFYNWYIIWFSRSLLMLINIVNVKPTKINQWKPYKPRRRSIIVDNQKRDWNKDRKTKTCGLCTIHELERLKFF